MPGRRQIRAAAMRETFPEYARAFLRLAGVPEGAAQPVPAAADPATPLTEDEASGEEIDFLSVADVRELHAESVRRFSPGESLALRAPGLLESAVLNPQQTFGGEYVHRSLAEMAAAYVVGIALNHAFENGNKRAAFAACAVFLRMNGYRLTLTQDEAVALILNVMAHTRDRDGTAAAIESGMTAL